MNRWRRYIEVLSEEGQVVAEGEQVQEVQEVLSEEGSSSGGR